MKKIIVGLLAAVMLLMMAMSASAWYLQVVSPAASGNVAGYYTVNWTVTDYNFNTTDGNNVNCSVYAKSASTANSSWSTLITNDTMNISKGWNISTFDSTLLEDSNDYIFNVTCYNETNASDFKDNTSSAVVVDNTAPPAMTTDQMTPSTGTDRSDVSFSVTVGGANVTGCTLYAIGTIWNESGASMTHSGDTCTYTKSGLGNGDFIWFVKASDGTNITTSSEETLKIVPQSNAGSAGGGGGGHATTTAKAVDLTSVEGVQEAAKSDQGKKVILLLAIVGVVGYIKGWFKKRK